VLEHADVRSYHRAQAEFRAALCNSFNTPVAVGVIMDLIGKVNQYFSARGRDLNVEPVRVVAEWITRMLRMFGLGEGAYTEGSVGWGKAGEEGSGGADVSAGSSESTWCTRRVVLIVSLQFEAQLDKYIRALSSFRDDVRRIAIAGGSNKDILTLCDRFRDVDLFNLGVQLDDGQGAGERNPRAIGSTHFAEALDGGALYKLVDPAVLIRQREEKAQIAADKAAKKAATAAAVEAKRIAALEKGRIPPREMFRPPNVPEGLYSQWDESGVPTHDAEGKEVSKGLGKKCAKEWKAQEAAHAKYLEWQKEGGK
jgi:cysteinyl-tRNA synthetase